MNLVANLVPVGQQLCTYLRERRDDLHHFLIQTAKELLSKKTSIHNRIEVFC